MVAEFKRENKYLVLKWDDVRRFLHPNDGENLDRILTIIADGRQSEGKKENSYVVVNMDEPYAEQVWKLIQAQWEKEEQEREEQRQY